MRRSPRAVRGRSPNGTGGVSVRGYSNYGVNLDKGRTSHRAAVNCPATGIGGDSRDGSFVNGVFDHSSSTITSGGGSVTVTGTAGTGNYQDYGIWVGGSTITSGGGEVVVTGTGGRGPAVKGTDGPTTNNIGVYTSENAMITSGGSAGRGGDRYRRHICA